MVIDLQVTRDLWLEVLFEPLVRVVKLLRWAVIGTATCRPTTSRGPLYGVAISVPNFRFWTRSAFRGP